MSNSEDNGEQPERAAFQKLEQAVGSLMERVGRTRERALAAESRSLELDTLLARFTEDGDAAGQLLDRLHELEAENGDLRDRLSRGREGVERLLARIRFLEGQR